MALCALSVSSGKSMGLCESVKECTKRAYHSAVLWMYIVYNTHTAAQHMNNRNECSNVFVKRVLVCVSRCIVFSFEHSLSECVRYYCRRFVVFRLECSFMRGVWTLLFFDNNLKSSECKKWCIQNIWHFACMGARTRARERLIKKVKPTENQSISSSKLILIKCSCIYGADFSTSVWFKRVSLHTTPCRPCARVCVLLFVEALN